MRRMDYCTYYHTTIPYCRISGVPYYHGYLPTYLPTYLPAYMPTLGPCMVGNVTVHLAP